MCLKPALKSVPMSAGLITSPTMTSLNNIKRDFVPVGNPKKAMTGRTRGPRHLEIDWTKACVLKQNTLLLIAIAKATKEVKPIKYIYVLFKRHILFGIIDTQYLKDE